MQIITRFTLLLVCALLLSACRASHPHAARCAKPTSQLGSATKAVDSTRPLSLADVAAEQEGLLAEFQRSEVTAFRERSAQLLTELWNAGLLKEEIQNRLVDDHYQLVLRQLSPESGVPSWDVRSHLSFPFPEIYTDFTPALFQNGIVKWAPGEPQTSCAMTGTANPITSMTGGEFKNGDVLQCRIDLQQNVNGKCWRRGLWTNKIVLYGLRP